MPIAIKINPKDNVVVALHPIAKGTAVPVDNTTVTAQISLDRGKLISESREQSKSDSDSSDASAKPDFDAMRSALADKQFSLADYQKYAKASSAMKSTIIWRPRGWRRPTISSRSPIRPVRIHPARPARPI